LSFDASILKLWRCAWGTLYIASKTARLAGSDLIQLLHDKAITTALLLPAVLAVLPAQELPVLSNGYLGEACSSEIVEQWAAGRQFFNAYGPTEVTIWATVAQLSDSSAKPRLGARLPIHKFIYWMLIFSLYRLEL